MIVLLSVAASIGIFGFLGVSATLIIFEIIPFLVLAVGVDNIFILVQTYQRDIRRPSETLPEHLGRVVGEVAPSMLLSSSSEATCFFLGALSDMPAVRAFALYAGMALLIDFFMQITCFVSLIALDMARQENNRWDVFCCVRGSKKDHTVPEGMLYKLFKHLYAPFLMKKWIRASVVVIFFAWLCSSLAVIPKIEIGLDQEISMPDDSFVLKYFKFLNEFLSVGPPFYIVVNSTNLKFDFALPETRNKICGASECNVDSLVNTVALWAKVANTTYVASPAFSWIDDYPAFLKSEERCCQFKEEDPEDICYSEDRLKMIQAQESVIQSWIGEHEDYDYDYDDPVTTVASTTLKASKVVHKEFLPDHVFENYDEFYYYDDDSVAPQKSRRKREAKYAKGRCKKGCCKCLEDVANVTEIEFRKYYNFFTTDNPNEKCPNSGHAAYSDSVRTKEMSHIPSDYEPDLPDLMISASNFMVYHTILKTSKDYYEALRWSRKLCSEIEEMINANITDKADHVKVFPYSVFYVFYEQYLTMWEDTLKSLGISLAAIFVVTFFMLGLDLVSSIISLIVILMILINLGGMMYWWDITLNAVSLVNLVMAVGISVEFSSHITRAFAVNVGDNRVQRATETLITMGSSVSFINA